MAGPEGDRILHVNMTDQTTSFEDFQGRAILIEFFAYW